jgi:hypothetical protein
MVKKAIIVINLLPEASKASKSQIEAKIRKESKIPLCKSIKKVSVEDNEASYMKLKKHGVSDNVARNLVELYTE